MCFLHITRPFCNDTNEIPRKDGHESLAHIRIAVHFRKLLVTSQSKQSLRSLDSGRALKAFFYLDCDAGSTTDSVLSRDMSFSHLHTLKTSDWTRERDLQSALAIR